MALKNVFYSRCGLEGVNILGVVLIIAAVGYPNREQLNGIRWDLRVRAIGENQARLMDQKDGWYNYLAHILYEFYETVTWRGDKSGWVYVPVTGDQLFADYSRPSPYFAKALDMIRLRVSPGNRVGPLTRRLRGYDQQSDAVCVRPSSSYTPFGFSRKY